MIHKRLSILSCNEQEYEKVNPLYASALNERGYKTTMRHTKTATNRNRARNIIWFNSIQDRGSQKGRPKHHPPVAVFPL